MLRRKYRSPETATLFATGVATRSDRGPAPTSSASAKPSSAPKQTIVLVHGAWADSSTWKGVVIDLQRKGYTVDVPPNPLRGIASDAAYLDKYLATITGPIVLAGHSYGGTVISNAAVGNTNVKALVYDDAFIPTQGETLMDEIGAEPGSLLAVPPQNAFNFVPLTNDPAGPVDLYVKPSIFGAVFAANLPTTRTNELAATQSPLINTAVNEPSGPVAWATIPSWDVVGLQDMLIPPAEQLAMATRAHSHVVEINAPHLSLVTNPSAVANTIVRAASVTS